jgi:hypothetical protein
MFGCGWVQRFKGSGLKVQGSRFKDQGSGVFGIWDFRF